MDFPQYDQYSKWFGDGPMATRYGMDQMDLAKQFQTQKYQQEGENLRKTTLANQFDEQNNPLKTQEQQLRNTGLDLANRGVGVDTRIKEATEPLQLDATQKEFINKASKADLDALEYNAQRMIYSRDPKVVEQGLELQRMHKDFTFLREQQKFTAAENEKNRAAELRAAQVRASSRGSGGSGSPAGPIKMSTDQYRSILLQRMEQARAMNDKDGYAYLTQQLELVNDIKAQDRPDPLAGKPDTGAMGIPANAPRPKPVVPPLPAASTNPAAAQQPKPALPSGWVMK